MINWILSSKKCKSKKKALIWLDFGWCQSPRRSDWTEWKPDKVFPEKRRSFLTMKMHLDSPFESLPTYVFIPLVRKDWWLGIDDFVWVVKPSLVDIINNLAYYLKREASQAFVISVLKGSRRTEAPWAPWSLAPHQSVAQFFRTSRILI